MLGLAESGLGADQRELMRLEVAGLITTHRIGNQKHLDLIDGSAAKNKEHAASDIDWMVIGDISSNAALLGALAPASIELGRPINPTLYTQRICAAELPDIDRSNAITHRTNLIAFECSHRYDCRRVNHNNS